MAIMQQNRAYQAHYRTEEEDDTQADELAVDSNTSDADSDENLSAEEKSYKQRYRDLHSFKDKTVAELNKQIQSLQTQLLDTNKPVMPSTPEEIATFKQQFPDVFRNFETIALQTVMEKHKDLELKIQFTQQELDDLHKKSAEETIRHAHKDYDELKFSKEFAEWAQSQPKSVKAMLFESNDPEDCIAGLDRYKAQMKAKPGPKPRNNADTLVNPRGQIEMPDNIDGKKVWTASEVKKLKPAQYEKFEADIEAARREGRFNPQG